MAENKFFSIDELGEMPPPRWAIAEMFEINSLVMVAGPPASFKSFLVLDWILCMACGKEWNGRKTEEAKVLYVLGEGRSSLLKRVQTWIHYNKLSAVEMAKLRENFKVTFDVPQMAQKSSVDNMLVGLQESGFSPSVICIDTFARSFVGMDENSQKDTGLWIEQADRLRSLGYTVIFLHHTAKNTEFGVKYRGSSSIMGAMDTAMTLTREPDIANGVKLCVTKQKDHDEGDPLYFTRVIVTPPNIADGSVVLVPTVKADERFTEEGHAFDEEFEKLYADESYASDWKRAEALALKFPEKTNPAAAQKKFQRKRERQQKFRVSVETF